RHDRNPKPSPPPSMLQPILLRGFYSKGRNENAARRTRHPTKRAEDPRQPPSLKARCQETGQRQSQKQAFAISNGKKIGGKKNKKDQRAALGAPPPINK